MLATLPLVAQLLVVTQTTCDSTTFGGPGDKWAAPPAAFLGRAVNNTEMGIAHRSLPGLSTVLVCLPRTNRCEIAQVVDRGPYGAILPPGVQPPFGLKCHYKRKGNRCWYVKKKKRWPGRWLGCADLTPALGRALGHDGRDRIELYWVVKEKRGR